jgi:hypothetical protein
LVDTPDRADHAKRQLLGRHFHAEDGDGGLVTDGRVLGNVDGERRLAHRGPARDHDEIAALQPRSQRIHLREARGHPRDVAARMAQHVQAIDRMRQDLLDRDETRAAAVPAVRDFEYALLGEVDELADAAALVAMHARGDVAADTDELAQHRVLAHDLRVGAHIGGARRLLDEARDVVETARGGELTEALEMLTDRYRVGRLAAFDERADYLEDQAVIGAIEVVDVDGVGDLIPGALVEHEAAEQRPFRFDRVRR